VTFELYCYLLFLTSKNGIASGEEFEGVLASSLRLRVCGGIGGCSSRWAWGKMPRGVDLCRECFNHHVLVLLLLTETPKESASSVASWISLAREPSGSTTHSRIFLLHFFS
jgi:hypothetical protein